MTDGKFNITQAAEAAGVSRRTLQRHLNEGKISSRTDVHGNKYLEAAELIRAYGDITAPDVTPHVAPEPGNVSDLDTPTATRALRDQIVNLQRELHEEKEARERQESRHDTELESLREDSRKREDRFLDILDRYSRLLTYEKDEPESTPSKPTTATEPAPHPAIEAMQQQVNRLTKQNKWLNYQFHMDRRTWWEKLIGKRYAQPEKAPSD